MDRASCEYAHWGFHDLPTTPGTPQVQLDGGAWVDLEWWNDTTADGWADVATDLRITAAEVTAGTAGIARLLVAGPDADANPANPTVLAIGVHHDKVRLADTPEVISRLGGGIRIT